MSQKKDDRSIFSPHEPDNWQDHWKGMPEYKQEDQTPYKSITIHFRNDKDIDKFAKLVKQKIVFSKSGRVRPSIWFPKKNILILSDKRYIDKKRCVELRNEP